MSKSKNDSRNDITANYNTSDERLTDLIILWYLKEKNNRVNHFIMLSLTIRSQKCTYNTDTVINSEI